LLQCHLEGRRVDPEQTSPRFTASPFLTDPRYRAVHLGAYGDDVLLDGGIVGFDRRPLSPPIKATQAATKGCASMIPQRVRLASARLRFGSSPVSSTLDCLHLVHAVILPADCVCRKIVADFGQLPAHCSSSELVSRRTPRPSIRRERRQLGDQRLRFAVTPAPCPAVGGVRAGRSTRPLPPAGRTIRHKVSALIENCRARLDLPQARLPVEAETDFPLARA
jgi:hypothetical protein